MAGGEARQIVIFWEQASAAAAKPLSEDDFLAAMDAIKARDDWERAHPHGIDPENPHIVGSRTRDRLIRDGGGYAICGICGLCYIRA